MCQAGADSTLQKGICMEMAVAKLCLWGLGGHETPWAVVGRSVQCVLSLENPQGEELQPRWEGETNTAGQ